MPEPPVASQAVASGRLFADRRCGLDRRREGRRRAMLAVRPERRQVVDRRRGAERRSTLERRGRPARGGGEAPAEHLRNALQLLGPLTLVAALAPHERTGLMAALDRLRRALDGLERRSR